MNLTEKEKQEILNVADANCEAIITAYDDASDADAADDAAYEAIVAAYKKLEKLLNR